MAHLSLGHSTDTMTREIERLRSRILQLEAEGGGVTTEWQPIETAPKSTVENGCVLGVYILGYCPDDSLDPQACISVIWWEPLMNNGRGQWHGEATDMPMRPTHWMNLPAAPKE